MTKEQKKALRNHIPTVIEYANLFLRCLDVETDPEVEKDYLIELIDKMENVLAGAKNILNE